MASNEDKDRTFKVIGKGLRSTTTKVRGKLQPKFGDAEREKFEAASSRISNLASRCHGHEKAVESEQQLVNDSSQGVPQEHASEVPQVSDKERMELHESEESSNVRLQEDRFLYESEIAGLKRTIEKQARKLIHEGNEKNAWKKRFHKLEAMNDNLVRELEGKKKLVTELEEKNKKIADLQEQVTDLMYHLDAQQRVASAPDETRQELQESTVFLCKGPSPRPRQPKKTGKRSRKP